MVNERYGDVGVTVDGHVVVAEVQRGPNNHFDVDLIDSLSQLYEDVDKYPDLRAIVLCAEGKHFCAGANLVSRSDSDRETEADGRSPLYTRATRMIAAKTPVVAAVQGAAVGGRLGLACSADFRVGCSETRMMASAIAANKRGVGSSTPVPDRAARRSASVCSQPAWRCRLRAITEGLFAMIVNRRRMRCSSDS